MVKASSRRRFLQSAPLAAAAAFTLADQPLAAHAATPVPFQFITAAEIADDIKALHAAPGNNNLVTNPALPFTLVLTVEEKKAAKEFEYHEGRDHILQVLEGSTVYEIGGTPVSPHSPKANEWLAPDSTGATRLALKKGDTLVIPRNTPHKRTTEGSVTFVLISTTGNP